MNECREMDSSWFFGSPLSWQRTTKGILFLLLISSSSFLFAANWQASFKNRLYFHYNTCLYLSDISGASQGKRVSINMRMREQGHPFFSFQKNMDWIVGLQPVSISYFRFSKGNYEVFIDIYCAETGEMTSLKYDYACVPMENGLHASDIFLDYEPIRSLGENGPILTELVDEKKQKLYFYQEIHSPKNILTARAILYQEKKSQEDIKATTYASVRQVNQILAMQNRAGLFVGEFDLGSLLAGKYLIEILIYADAQLLAEKSIRFEISAERVFLRSAEIDKSIDNLVLLCTPQQIGQIKALSSVGEKKALLLRIFEQRYPNEALLQADLYFAKIHHAHQRFLDEVDFWHSARIGTFLRYGEPDMMEELVVGGRKFQKWKYKKWNLLFLFEKKEKGWVLSR